ncbi:hypothetical protein [Pseudomonas sp. OIL-1]|uniref:hypothetical protein n=1 Tax=Pseudomonas sp. OIL-1 TaxID=2706126 RepID=UPI0013A7B37C|nr:hypothetical protein [Pseudomonas sp. OIL-1]QIB51068.1 hypothetical protein G3M63_08400 [Pseudomonas sp. OIL-1]
MQPIRAEIALARVLAYLQWTGVNIDAGVERQALRIVAEALEADAPDFFQACMEMVKERFELLPAGVPVPAPPICRGSIGYGTH